MSYPDQHIRMPASTARPAKRQNPEQKLQRSLVQGLRAALPHGWIIRADRGNSRNRIMGAIEKGMGAVKGWPDIEIIGRDSRDRPATWHLEVKAPRGHVKQDQAAVHDTLRDLGRPVAVVRSWEDVCVMAREWGWPFRVVGSR